MSTFTIDAENNITAHATLPAGADESQSFSTAKELARLTAEWPMSRLVDTWNSFAGVAPFGASPKSEFETTDAFEARIADVPEKFKKQMVFPLVLGASQSIRYNADRGLISVGLFESFPISGNRVLQVLPLRRVVHEYPPYMASNSFGVTKPISRKVVEEQGIEMGHTRVIGLEFPLEAQRARIVKPFLCFAVQGTVSQALVYSATSRHAPTMSEPSDSVVAGEYVPVTVSQFLAIDIRDGSLVAAIPLR